jgi:hypothetical protein
VCLQRTSQGFRSVRSQRHERELEVPHRNPPGVNPLVRGFPFSEINRGPHQRDVPEIPGWNFRRSVRLGLRRRGDMGSGEQAAAQTQSSPRPAVANWPSIGRPAARPRVITKCKSWLFEVERRFSYFVPLFANRVFFKRVRTKNGNAAMNGLRCHDTVCLRQTTLRSQGTEYSLD